MSAHREITFRIEIHLFRGAETEPEIQIWEKRYATAFPNPLLLKAEDWDGDRTYLFSLSEWEDEKAVATFYPYATHEKLALMRDLPKFGFNPVPA